MGKIDSGSKSNRLLASRRYTHNTYTTAQEAFTNVLDLRSEEIFTQAHHITASNLPYSGSSQHGSTLSVGGNEIKKYWYRHKLTPSSVNNEVWLFLSPTGSDDGVGAQLLNDNQQTNFISPKYAVSALANATTEDSTPGYLAAVFKSSAVSQSAQTGSLSSGDLVSTNDYQFDYKTGVVQFLNSDVDPTDSQYIYMTVYQYVGKTLKTGLEVEGNISGSAISTGSFGQLNATEFSSDTATLISGSTNPAAVSGSWQGVIGSGSLGMVSGSAISTGSFGLIAVAGNAGFDEYISHNGDADTYIRYQPDQIDIVVGAANMIYLNEGGGGTQADKVTINNDAADVDFQVKGDNDTNLFRTDALNDTVGIGTASAANKLEVHGDFYATGSISGSSTSTGSFGRLELSASLSASATSTGSFGAVYVGGMSVSNVKEVSSSIASRAATLEGSGTIQGVGTTNAVTFATVDTGQGANELYDMDQNVKTDSNVTFANVTATGIVTAEEFHTEFVSASIVYASGSTKFGDTSDDIHSFTGSVHLVNSGSVSGSIFSTGSFGAVYVGGMTVPNLINVSSSVSSRVNLLEGSGSITESSASFSTRTTTLENANISGGFVAQTVLSGSGTLISGSVLSTGSFGRVIISEMGNSDLTVVSSSVSTRTTTLENANISGGFVAQTVLSGSGTLFSGSVLSTGSFASLRVTSPQTLTIDNTGTVSGSATSTGSFGSISVATSASLDSLVTSKADINGGTIDGTTIGAASHTTIKGTTIDATTDFTIDGLVLTADTITNDATLTIDGADDMVIDVDGGNFDVKDDGVALLNISATKVSGSATSTGSFGKVIVAEMGNSDLTVVSSSVSTRTTTLENANISGGFVAQTVLSGSGTIFSGSVLSTGSFGSLRVTSPQTLTIDNTGTVSGSATSTGSFGYLHIGGNITASGTVKADAFESVTGGTTIDFGDSLDITGDITASGDVSGSSTSTGSFGAIDVTGMSVSNLVDVSSSFSTRVTTEEGNVDDLQTDSGSFSTRVGLLEGSGSITESSASYSTRVTLLEGSGSITESSASFSTRVTDLNLSLSGSTTLISGSSLSTGSFGSLRVTSPQTLTIDNAGTVSGSATSTGSFGHFNATELGSSISTLISGSTNPAAVSGSWQGVIGSGSLGMVSGSAISTGSFGAVSVAGMTVSNLLDFSSSIASRITDEESDFTAAGISGSWQGVIGSGSLGMVSGSAISTGSFGRVIIAEMGNSDLTNVSSSVSSRTSDLESDSGSFSTRVNLLEGSGSITESSSSFSTRTTTLENANISGGFVAQAVLSGSGALISGSIQSTGSFGSLRVTSPQTLTIDNKGTVSGSATSTGSFGAVNVAGMSVSNIIDVSSSVSSRTTTLEGTGTIQGVGQGNAVTFATVDTGQGANELYDMDQNVKTDSNVTFANVTATGTVTAEEFHTEFVSASIVYASGSTKFGDTSDDIHSFTGSIHLVNSGSVSGSSTSTGSFGAIYAGGMTVPNLIDFSSSIASRVATEESAFTAAGISGSWQGVVGSGSLGMVSGSAISTGSFGAVNIAGMTVSNLIDFSSSIASRVTTEESDFTAAGISGSWQGVIGSGSLGMVSGSAISTGSFGRLEGNGEGLTNITAVPFLKTGSYYSATTDVKITGSLSVSGNISGSYSGLSVGQKYLHTQTSANTTWTISHNFDYKFVNVDVYDSNDQIVIPTSITATDTNTITLTFGSAISGNAIVSTGGQAIDEKGKNKQHIQSTAATNWRVTHSVGEQYPSVTVYDDEDNVIQPQQIYAASAQRMDIVFAQPQSGNANFSVGGGISLSAITSSVQLSGVNFGDISGSATSTGSFGALRVVGQTLKVDSSGSVSGSSTSTGSFGHINATELGSDISTLISGSLSATAVSGSWQGVVGSGSLGMYSGSAISTGSFGAVSVAGMTVPNLLDFSSSLASRITSEEGDFTAAGISGSWQGVVGSGSLGMVSGSAISTGSFGHVEVAGMTTPSILALSSSIETRLNTLSADIIALSIALG